MGAAALDDQYIAELAGETVKAMGLKKNGTLLGLGGGEWEFAKAVFAATNGEAKSLLVADKDAELLQHAEAAGVPMTSTCDIADFEQLETLGKYDGVVAKGVLEQVAGSMSSLEDFIFALYKTVRLKGKAVLVSRLRPTIPLPPIVLEAWHAGHDSFEKVPSVDELMKEAAECGFTPSVKTVAYPVSLDATIWKAHLLHGGGTRHIPFIDAASKDDIESYISTQGHKIAFKDEINIVTLTKIISRTPTVDAGK